MPTTTKKRRSKSAHLLQASDLMMRVRTRVVELMKQHDLTLTAVGARADLDYKGIKTIMDGKGTNITTVERLAAGFGMSAAEFLYCKPMPVEPLADFDRSVRSQRGKKASQSLLSA